jgi:iron complex transport system substrate-binding protein
MKKIILLLIPILLMSGCARSPALPTNGSVAVYTESLTDLWLLAGGEVAATTQDSFDLGLPLSADTMNLGSIRAVDVEQIAMLAPSLVLLSESVPGHADVAEWLDDIGIRYELLNVETFDDYLTALKRLTDITGRTDLYEQNGIAVQARVNAVVERGTPGGKVLLLRAQTSGVSVQGSDSLAGKMLSDLGCVNISDGGVNIKGYPNIEAVWASDPEYVFITLMGNENAARQVWDNLLESPVWSELSAVKNGKVYVLPKELFHQKPNERWDESYEMLAEILGN